MKKVVFRWFGKIDLEDQGQKGFSVYQLVSLVSLGGGPILGSSAKGTEAVHRFPLHPSLRSLGWTHGWTKHLKERFWSFRPFQPSTLRSTHLFVEPIL